MHGLLELASPDDLRFVPDVLLHLLLLIVYLAYLLFKRAEGGVRALYDLQLLGRGHFVLTSDGILDEGCVLKCSLGAPDLQSPVGLVLEVIGFIVIMRLILVLEGCKFRQSTRPD